MGRNQSAQRHSTDFAMPDDVVDMMTGNTDMLLRQLNDPINEREFEDNVEYEEFMQNPIVIRIHETTDKNAPPLVGVGVNGNYRWLPRSVKIRVQRMFVEVLARSHERSIKTVENPDKSVEDGMMTKRTQAQSYGFQVLHDPHPKGNVWLERVTRQGC